MRLSWALFVTAVVLRACANALSAQPQLESTTPTTSKTSTTAAQSSLIAKMDEDERAISGIPVKGQLLSNLSKLGIAKLTETFQISKLWLTRKSVDGAFVCLKLDKAGDRLLASSRFRTWAKYVMLTTKGDPYTQMAATLATHLGDIRLATILEAAAWVKYTRRMAIKLRNAQFKVWDNKKLSLDDVFALLEIDPKVGNLFRNPLIYVWIRYGKSLEKFPYRGIAANLETRFDRVELAIVLETTATVAYPKRNANVLQDIQLRYWVDSGLTADSAFVSLKLDEIKDGLLLSPHFKVWAKFMARRYKQSDLAMVATLSARLGDENLAIMLEAATRVVDTQDIGTRLQKVQMKTWIYRGISSDMLEKNMKASPGSDDPIDILRNRVCEKFSEISP